MSFDEWREHLPSGLRPLYDDGEVAKWRLAIELGPVGEAFMTLQNAFREQQDGAE